MLKSGLLICEYSEGHFITKRKKIEENNSKKLSGLLFPIKENYLRGLKELNFEFQVSENPDLALSLKKFPLLCSLEQKALSEIKKK